MRKGLVGIRGLPGILAGVGRGREALPKVREGSGGPLRSTGEVGRVREALLEVQRGRESLPKVRERFRGPSGSPGRVGRPNQKSGRHWEALPEVREESGVVRRTSTKSRRGREVLPEVWERSGSPSEVREESGGPPVSPGGVGRPAWKFGRPSRKSGDGSEALPEVQEGSGGLPGSP